MQNETKLKMLFWGLLDLLILVAVVNVVFFVMPALSNLGASFAPARTITVSAEGKTTVSPDTATISFSVMTQGKNPQDLSTNNTDKMNAAIEFLKSQGISEKDVKTTNYNLSPDYRYDQNTQRNYITGYTLTQTVSVKIHDFTKIAPVLAGLTPLGVNEIGGVNFTVDNPDALLSAARTDALKKAQTKAQEIASQSGARLGKIVSVSESGSVPPIRYFAQSAGAGAMSAPAVPTIEPGTQDLTLDEQITYALE